MYTQTRSRIHAGLLAFALATAAPASAQTTATGSVRGIVSDQQGAAVPGVVIAATSPTVPGVQTATTDLTGAYRLGDLAPGVYTLTGELTGFARVVRTPVIVRAGLNLDVDMVLRVGSVDEIVEVRQETPLLETTRAGQAVNVDGDVLRAIPLTERREWFGAFMLAPGVVHATFSNNNPLFYVHGADATANIIQIDGADMTPAALSSITYVNLSTEAIDDIQIKTSGVDASAPLGLGGIVNIATASGTNRVAGTATLFHQPRAWNDSNNPGGTSSTVAQTQADLSAGAPIVKDRLWVYGAYRHSDISTGISRTAAQLEALRGLVANYAPQDTQITPHFWFAKVNARLSSGHQMTGFNQYDVNPRRVVDPIGVAVTKENTGGRGISVRLSSIWSNRLTTRIGASYNDKRRTIDEPEVKAPLQRVYQGTILSAGRLSGNGLLVNRGSPFTAWSVDPDRKVTLSADATLVAPRALGDHQVQTGVYLQPRLRIASHLFYVNDGLVIEEQVLRRPGDYAAGTIPFHLQVVDGRDLLATSREGQDYAFYVQDAWRPTSRLTINAGLRVDHIAWRDGIFDVQSQRSTQIGPRFGVNYALSADARHVARAHWVRVHDQPAAMSPSVGSTTLRQRDLYDLDLNGTFETEFITPETFAATRGRTIDPDLHQASIEEWGTGYTRQLPGSVAVGVDFLRRAFLDRPALVETNARYEGSVFRGYVDENFNEMYTLTNNRWNQPIYMSLEVTATKRTQAIQAIASYVRNWRSFDGTWQPRDPAAFIQPSAFENTRGIGATNGVLSTPVDANSLSGTHQSQRSTASAQWQDHVARIGITLVGPWRIMLAGRYELQSGIWSGPIVTRLSAPDPAFGPATVSLSNGRLVNNPLATVIRFAYPTRTEGQLRTPAAHTLNLRAGRKFGWRRVQWDASLDVFNVTNHDADLSFQSGANQTYNPVFGLTTSRQLPRSAQVVLRVSF
jgi:hypothetical protein